MGAGAPERGTLEGAARMISPSGWRGQLSGGSFGRRWLRIESIAGLASASQSHLIDRVRCTGARNLHKACSSCASEGQRQELSIGFHGENCSREKTMLRVIDVVVFFFPMTAVLNELFLRSLLMQRVRGVDLMVGANFFLQMSRDDVPSRRRRRRWRRRQSWPR